MMTNSFENLEVWKAGCRLSVSVIKEMNKCQIYGFRDQLIRSAISIPSNIAEGSERHTKKDFRHFVHIALGSTAELRTQAYIGKEAKLIEKDIAEQWIKELKIISKMLQGLSNSLKL